MKPKVYLETTIPSLLTGWPQRDLVLAADQQVTREWWETRRVDFQLFISQVVLDEAGEGDPTAAATRLEVLRELPILAVTADVEAVVKSILRTKLIPPKAADDAAHLAIAAVHGMHFLLTWNCRHLANAAIAGGLAEACQAAGYKMPVICTPRELIVRPEK